MPNPDRLVRRSLTMLRSIGYSDVAALTIVKVTARLVREQLDAAGYTDTDWLDQVATIAQDRLASHHPSDTDHRRSDHGDGPGGRTGRTA